MKRKSLGDLWLEFINKEFGSLEDFNKLDYQTRHEIWEEWMNEN